MKTFQLQSSMLISDETIVSIPNPYHNRVMPYWISDPKGGKIKKIKLMVGSTNMLSGVTGSVKFKLYKSVTTAPVKKSKLSKVKEVHTLGKGTIEGDWELITEMVYTIQETEYLLCSEYKNVNIDIKNSAYLVGTVEVQGDMQASELFVWIDYENNSK